MNTKLTQQTQVLRLLESPNPNGYTRMQIARCLGIERASVCRRVAELRDLGLIWVVKVGLDPITNERASFLTANKMVAMTLPPSAKIVKNKPEETGCLF